MVFSLVFDHGFQGPVDNIAPAKATAGLGSGGGLPFPLHQASDLGGLVGGGFDAIKGCLDGFLCCCQQGRGVVGLSRE
ncbi:MAG: hypothetical protein ACOY9Y_08950 [Bacillota bacterium]